MNLSKDNDMYLSDKQYLMILDKIEKKINLGVKPIITDDNMIGYKDTNSNIGFCNKEYTTLETALFPEQFKSIGRKSLKYRLSNHACPFDNRIRTKKNLPGKLMKLDCGCFYTCLLNSNKLSNEELKELVIDTRNKFLNGELDSINEILSK